MAPSGAVSRFTLTPESTKWRDQTRAEFNSMTVSTNMRVGLGGWDSAEGHRRGYLLSLFKSQGALSRSSFGLPRLFFHNSICLKVVLFELQSGSGTSVKWSGLETFIQIWNASSTISVLSEMSVQHRRKTNPNLVLLR